MEVGKKQKLQIVKLTLHGAYLAEAGNREERVLLPKKQIPEGAGLGDELEVFIYRDSEDRLISTVQEPKLTLGGLARLKVVQVAKVGAFLDWGLEKDLFLPYREQTRKVQEGDCPLVTLYVDKSGRLSATMNVYPSLRRDAPYEKEDVVHGIIYEISKNFGVFVAVDDCYSGLIPAKEDFGHFRIGEEVECRVTGVREDGKLNLSPRRKAYLQMDEDAGKILEILKSCGGELPFNDKASPEVIRQELNMSKNGFKRAVGRLLKEGKIVLTEHTIRSK
jgi:hypothetical protein